MFPCLIFGFWDWVLGWVFSFLGWGSMRCDRNESEGGEENGCFSLEIYLHVKGKEEILSRQQREKEMWSMFGTRLIT